MSPVVVPPVTSAEGGRCVGGGGGVGVARVTGGGAEGVVEASEAVTGT